MLNIYGLKRTTLIDFPGRIACIAFTHGCTLRCPFCQNAELVVGNPEELETMSEKALLDFLNQRKGKLDGIVFSGGEPLMRLDELRPVISEIRRLGFQVKIDTNGTLTDALRSVIREELADFIAMDFKTTPSLYSSVRATKQHVDHVLQSLDLLKKSSVQYEIRTTLVPGMHDSDVLAEMMPFVADVPSYVLQNFEPNGTIDPAFRKKKSFSREEMARFLTVAKAFNPSSSVRIPD